MRQDSAGLSALAGSSTTVHPTMGEALVSNRSKRTQLPASFEGTQLGVRLTILPTAVQTHQPQPMPAARRPA